MTGTVVRILNQRIGLDLSTVGDTLILRAVAVRMGVLKQTDRSAYEELLTRSDAEQQALVEEIVIPESWFFRDDRPFARLRDWVRSRWVADPLRPPLRVLSLPCANGEEPYSLAICFLELGLPAARFRVDAVDVSQRCIDRASVGIYGHNAFRGGSIPHDTPFFRPTKGGVEVAPEVRRTVRFHRGNVLDPHLLTDDGPYDLILCRNMLIYFDATARRTAFENLRRLLAADGLLFLGHADRAPDSLMFRADDDHGSFAFHHAPVGSTPPGLEPATRPAPVRRAAVTVASPAAAIEAAPPPPPPPPPPVAVYASPRRLLDQASALADQGRLAEATELCERSIREAGPSASACFLLGVIREADGDRAGAQAQFLRAVYLDADHDEALLALAVLARRRGDLAAEAGFRRRADRARGRKGTA